MAVSTNKPKIPRKGKPAEELPLAKRERQIMDVLYRRGGLTAREIQQDLPDAPGYSTVRTLLTLLVKKGHLTCSDEQRAHVYHPTHERTVAAESALRRLLRTFYDGSIAQAVSGLLSLRDQKLSAAELSRLEEMLKEAGKPTEK